jgi:hypothetical protein
MSKVPGGVIAFGVLDILMSLVIILGGITSIIILGIKVAAIKVALSSGSVGMATNSGGVIDPFTAFSAIFYVVFGIGILFGIFTIVSSIGLLRLKNWARVIMITLSGLFIVFSVAGLIVVFFNAAGAQFPIAELLIFILLSILPVFQIIYLTRLETRNFFL